MVAVAMGLLWSGYSVGLWGYCLVRGYNVGFVQLINPTTQFTWKSPMPMAGNTVIFPDGTKASTQTVALTAVVQPAPAGTGGGGGKGGGGGGAPVPSGASETTVIHAVLAGLGAPANAANTNSMSAWRRKETPWPPVARNNPWNTTLPEPGASNFNSVGVKNYVSETQGVAATVATLRGGYPQIIARLRSGQGLCGWSSAEFSKWSGGGYSSVC